jgi:DNA-directed RNA polymerase specialized sigma24 family protein
MSDVTRILSQIEAGDPQAAERLLPLVYHELRKLAAAKLAQEKPGLTLQATALVHEVYLRLAGGGKGAGDLGLGAEGSDVEARPSSPNPEPRTPRQFPSAPNPQPLAPPVFNSRGHFFAAAAEAMRRILVDNARRKQAEIHGGGRERVGLEESDFVSWATPEAIVALDDSLAKLAAEDAQAAEMVKLRVFAGMSLDEAADCLSISRATAHRHWTYARAWLWAERCG